MAETTRDYENSVDELMPSRLSGNEAVMARLLVDIDDENDPVPYEDDAADHKFAHPNYGGSENPNYEFFEAFKTAGQKEGVYCMDVPLTEDVREAFANEPENSLPQDRNQNYFRLEITIDKDGHPGLVLDGREGDALDEYLADVYNTSIRSGAEKFALERGIIADTTADAGWDENDPVPHDTLHVNPANAEWADFKETEKAPPEGISLREVDGQMMASVVVPENLQKEFDTDTLNDLGVNFDASGTVELRVKTDSGVVELNRQFPEYSYQGDFEQALFRHHKADLQAITDREVSAAKSALEGSITVAGESDFPDDDVLRRHLKVRVDDIDFNVIATFDEAGKVGNIEVDPDQDDVDPAMDGGVRYRELSALLETVKEPVALRAQEYHDNADQRILEDTGWNNSQTLQAGYCVIPASAIDQIGSEPDAADSYLVSGDFRTAEGFPIRLNFDVNGNIERSTIPGTKVSLKPVLEGSRDHFVEAKAQLADHGIVLSKGKSGDYRVDYHKSSASHRGGEYGSACFVDTVTEATEVGRKMAAKRDRQKSSSADNDEDRDRHRAVAA